MGFGLPPLLTSDILTCKSALLGATHQPILSTLTRLLKHARHLQKNRRTDSRGSREEGGVIHWNGDRRAPKKSSFPLSITEELPKRPT